MYVRTETFSLDWLCGDVHKNGNVFLGLTVCDIHTNGNVFLGFTVWDVHTYGNDFWDSSCGMYIPMEMIPRIQRVGCTYLRKWYLGFTMWDVHTYGNDFWDSPCGMYIPSGMISGIHRVGCTYLRKDDWVSMPCPIAHGPNLGPRRAYPRRFLGHVGSTPLSPTLTWRRFQMPSRKGLKTVCLARRCTSVHLFIDPCEPSPYTSYLT